MLTNMDNVRYSGTFLTRKVWKSNQSINQPIFTECLLGAQNRETARYQRLAFQISPKINLQSGQE